MYLEALKQGICSQFMQYDCTEVRQAVINLGGEEFVELKHSPSWWIKDYWNLPLWKRIYTRIRILIRVGGLSNIEQEILKIRKRFEKLPDYLDDLTPYKPIYSQLVIRHDIPVTMYQLRKILLSMDCPHIHTAEDTHWTEADTKSGIIARRDIIEFIQANWGNLRIRLCEY